MKRSDHNDEVFSYSSEMSPHQQNFIRIFSGFFLLMALIMVGAVIYFLVHFYQEDSIFLAIVLSFCSIVLSVVMIPIFLQTFGHKKFIQERKVFPDKMITTDIRVKENEKITEEILFSELDFALIGSLTQFVPGRRNIKHYNYRGVIVLSYDEGYFLQEISTEDELDQWIRLLQSTNVPLYSTPYDLSPALHVHKNHPGDVNFAKVPRQLWDETVQEKPIFSTERTHDIDYWQVEYYEDAKKRLLQEQAESSSNIQKAFWYSLIIYGLIIGCMMGIINDENQILRSSALPFISFVMSSLYLLGMAGSYRFVSWMQFMRFFLLLTLSNMFGILISMMVVGGTIELLFFPWQFNITMALSWVPLFLIIKLVKRIRARKREKHSAE